MNEPGFPCLLCGAARSCDHRTVDRPELEREEPAKPAATALQRQAFNLERYKPKRGEGSGFNFRSRKRGGDGRRNGR